MRRASPYKIINAENPNRCGKAYLTSTSTFLFSLLLFNLYYIKLLLITASVRGLALLIFTNSRHQLHQSLPVCSITNLFSAAAFFTAASMSAWVLTAGLYNFFSCVKMLTDAMNIIITRIFFCSKI